ncbi:hypothetical protein [Pedobacter sp. UBA5917]|jgi:hypothetical protein|uniref:hypothetical protein n=1 Tax=Pedobacter sp. UBA5917 TaxID=1947061 RepID=UPI0025D1969C|nr:hypothetical protein [Pedobacter sp. UBA5917]
MLKKTSKTAMVILALIITFSCKTVQQANLKEIKPFVGIWNDTTNPGCKIVFKADGSFYNLAKENGIQIVTHSGIFKILSSNMYVLTISDARANATYDLKGRQYANYYTLGADQKTMKVSGYVDGRNGGNGLKWASDLVKMNTLD